MRFEGEEGENNIEGADELGEKDDEDEDSIPFEEQDALAAGSEGQDMRLMFSLYVTVQSNCSCEGC